MNESRQTVETDTLWLSNIRALNFRKPGHLRKYCNNENFTIYGIQAFVMYCVYGESRSSLLIESTDSMISHELKGILKVSLSCLCY